MLHAGYDTLVSGHAPRVEDPFTLVVHDERQLLAACLAPDVITSLPSHSGACSNQNVLHPLGAYTGVQSCGCSRRTHA